MAYLQHKIYRYTACCQTFVLFHWTQKKIGRTSKRCQSTGLYWRTLESQSKCSNAELCCILYCTCNLLAVSCVMEKNPSVHLSVWPFFFVCFFCLLIFLLLLLLSFCCCLFGFEHVFAIRICKNLCIKCMYLHVWMYVCSMYVMHVCMYLSVCLSTGLSICLFF